MTDQEKIESLTKQRDELLAALKNVAHVYSACGRTYLDICGVAVAMQGDICRDGDMPSQLYSDVQCGRAHWTSEMLRYVAGLVTSKIEGASK